MRCEPISNLLRERIEAGDIPSAVYLVAENGKPVLSDALGSAVVDPGTDPASLDTIYDLASVTKPLVTSLLLAILIEQGRLDIETRLGDIPGFADIGAAADPTIGQLVSHTSGLPAWLPFYLLQDRSSGMSARGSVLDVVGRLDLAYVPGHAGHIQRYQFSPAWICNRECHRHDARRRRRHDDLWPAWAYGSIVRPRS